uniref:Uncharacterized protein n=1 Tax=Rhizophagus irregularis (strain DAOM 181602 / DAOM 197198 / MUCL 43194) TaxID=747089 RepID=U9UX53_RHIID
MCESVLYKCEQLPLNEAFEFIDDQLDQDEFNKYNANSNDNQIDMSNQNKEKIENIEDYYDFRQIYLKALISSVLRKSIKELMPIRWLHDSVWNCIDSIFDEPLFIDLATYTKKIEYSRLIGHFKRALDYSLKDNDQKNLDDILLAYTIHEKEQKQMTGYNQKEEMSFLMII